WWAVAVGSTVMPQTGSRVVAGAAAAWPEQQAWSCDMAGLRSGRPAYTHMGYCANYPQWVYADANGAGHGSPRQAEAAEPPEPYRGAGEGSVAHGRRGPLLHRRAHPGARHPRRPGPLRGRDAEGAPQPLY